VFRLDGLPREVGVMVDIVHPNYARSVRYAATTQRPARELAYPPPLPGRPRPSVSTGDLNLTMQATKQLSLRLIYSDTSRPAPNVLFSALGGGNTDSGRSDPLGNLLLKLPPGEYSATAYPPKGMDYVHKRTEFTVKSERVEQSLEVRLAPGCVLILEAVDAETGRGVPGVGFMAQMDDQPTAMAEVRSTTTIVDHPRTDADGRLRAVVHPGERDYSVGNLPMPAGYRQQGQTKHVTLTAGETVVVRFELQKQPQAAP
jgi:hypothetical protein